MIVLSNRDVFLFGQVADGGINAAAIWLKEPAIAGTNQELWSRFENTVHGLVNIPANTAQVHTDIFLPYATTAVGTTANNA